MALTRAKTVVLLCSVLVVMTFVIVQKTDILKVKPKQRSADFKSPKAELKGVSNNKTSKITGVWTDTPKPKMKSVLITQKPKVKGLQNTPTATITDFETDKPKPKAKEILTNTPRLLRTSEAKIIGVLNTLKPKAMSTISENRKNNNSNNNNNNKPRMPIVTSVPNTTKPKAMSTPSENRKNNSNNNNNNSNNNNNNKNNDNGNKNTLEPNVTSVSNTTKPKEMSTPIENRKNNNNNSNSNSSSSNNNGNKNTLKPNLTSVSNTTQTKVMSKHSNNKSSSSSKNNKASKPNLTSVSNTPKPKVMSTLSNNKNNNNNSSKIKKALKPIAKSVPNTPKPKIMSTLSNNKNNNNSISKNKTLKPNVTSMPITPKTKMQKWSYSLKEKESKWKRCKSLISGEEKLNKSRTLSNDSEILDMYKPNEDCAHVLQTRFVHPPVSKEEKQLPIAFGFTIYKGARLFERILQAIYMPNNVYCIHIDKKSLEVFRKAIQSMIRCLPNVFIAANSIDVVWGHFTVLQAQYSCMEELLKSSVRWKYYISLVGQDFPLYDNKEIVRALQGLNNFNNIQSEPMPKQNVYRTKFVFTLKNGRIKKANNKTKPPPPHSISIRKGSTHIIAIREFVEFVLHSQIGKDFNEFLKDTFVPDETLYSSLQRHPHVPGGIQGNQPMWIPRALYWLLKKTRNICHGIWVRQICWITLEDLRWALGEEKKEKLFVHKIPFNFNDELIECILVARQGRKYATAIWKEDKNGKT